MKIDFWDGKAYAFCKTWDNKVVYDEEKVTLNKP